ncbi:hypothetical protein SteCoe_24282 [Stentor coeruleus]|uniref:Uncharacterized protein n=1 Tax=Stentor coeruleus TaxID=5963 RepID=A0A1R2BI16_9CILI|nr:hypothetical protein SteCoe_24282 [Stentor coeruleus]
MNSPIKIQRRSFTYSLPSLMVKSKSLQKSGLQILQNSLSPQASIHHRFSIQVSEPAKQKQVNSRFLPYLYAQNPENTSTNSLPFDRKSGEIDLMHNMQINQVRSYTENCINVNF